MRFEKISEFFNKKVIRFKYKWFGIRPKWSSVDISPTKYEFFIETCPNSGFFYPVVRETTERISNDNIFKQPTKIVNTYKNYIYLDTRAPLQLGKFNLDLKYEYPSLEKDRKVSPPFLSRKDAIRAIGLYNELVLGNITIEKIEI
jgi:hypothetical protein